MVFLENTAKTEAKRTMMAERSSTLVANQRLMITHE